MAGPPARRRRRWWFLGLAVLAVVAVAGVSASWVVWRRYHQGQRMRIPGLPTRRTISVGHLGNGRRARAAWVDPASGARRPVPMSASFTPPGPNAAGDNDWLLVLTG